MRFKLLIRYVGHGKRCYGCGKIRETTRYSIVDESDVLQQFHICDACQDKGYEIQFNARSKEAMRAADRRRRIKKSQKLEAGLAQDVKGHVQPGSGNMDAKSDVRVVDEWRLEHKYTDSIRGFRLQVDDLAKVIEHGNMAGEWPGLVINFTKVGRRFIVLPFEVFLEFLEELRGKSSNNR